MAPGAGVDVSGDLWPVGWPPAATLFENTSARSLDDVETAGLMLGQAGMGDVVDCQGVDRTCKAWGWSWTKYVQTLIATRNAFNRPDGPSENGANAKITWTSAGTQ